MKILPELRKKFPEIEFLETNAVEEIGYFGKELLIIDSADGIKNACLITDLNQLETQTRVSMHDFDLAQTLKIMKKIGKIDSVKIFCLPTSMKKSLAIKELTALIKSTLF